MEDLVPTAVYTLCALTSLVCTLLLLRGYRQSRQRLQLFIALCFGGLTVNNILLPVDKVVLAADLSAVRAGVGLAATAALLVVLIWEAR